MQTRWAVLFEQKITERAHNAIEHLVGGGALDYGAYKEQVGYLRGLREAVSVVDEVDTTIIGGPREE